MAINPSTNGTMTGRITAATLDYPYGSSKNESAPGAGDGTPYFLARANDIFGLQQWLLAQAGIVPSGSADTVLASDYGDALSSVSQWIGTPIGSAIAIPTNLAGVLAPPTNKSAFRYILLSAGESGGGEYNETILTGETVSGSAPLLIATAVINLASSPINGLTVNLINSEGRYIKPGTSSGTVANDQMQQITGSLPGGRAVNGVFSGAFSDAGNYAAGSAGGSNTGYVVEMDSSNSPSARTATSTDVKHIQYTHYMRIA
jgi:hypothetical protein